METTELLRLYDEHERRQAELPGYTRMETAATVRMMDVEGRHSYLAYSGLTSNNAERLIDEEIAFFRSKGQGFEWKYYAHDRPGHLRDLLQARGCEMGEDEAIMALDLAEAPALRSEGGRCEIRRVTEGAGLDDVGSIETKVWDEDFGPHLDSMKSLLRSHPNSLSVYVAYVDGVPASAAWIRFPPHSPFASLWGGSTLEAYRKRGIYTELLGARMREAIGRGYRFLTIDASPMSRPIVERQGFVLLAMSNPCTFSAG